ncbi:MAG TPA: hypothetical protein DEP69_05175, partial [Acidimicrobiaceae bacterium]|nr:hypothetical protein [Acidimicrobiaceae bacterium]
MLRATASYTDARGPGKTIAETAAVPPVPPGAPAGLVATPGDGTVSLAWSEPEYLGGAPVLLYEYRQRTSSGTFGDWTGVGNATTTTVAELAGGETYYFVVRAANSAGYGTPTDEKSATLNAAPTVAGEAAPSYAENGDGVVGPYSASDGDDGDAVALAITGGADAARFTLAVDELRFRSAPDYENPRGSGGNAYVVVLTATDDGDPPLSGLLEVTVRVVNADDAGTVTITPASTPLVGETLTATLSDPDGGLAGITWQWQAGFVDIAGDDATAASYTVRPADAGATLRAVAFYADAHDIGKTATSALTAAVLAVPPGAPTGLEADAGNRSLILQWEPPTDTGGTPIIGYQVRLTQISGDYAGPLAGWRGIAVADLADPSGTVFDLDAGTEYFLQVRAVNSAGPGLPSDEVSQTPDTIPEAPAGLSAAPGVESVKLRWSTAGDGGSPIRGYEVLQATDEDFTGAEWTAVDPSTSGTTSTARSGLENGVEYFFRVRARNVLGPGAASGTVSATPRTLPGEPTGLTVSRGGSGELVLRWSAPADDGGSPVTGYEYLCGPAPRAGCVRVDWQPAGSHQAVELVLSGLENGMEHRFRVRARNEAGAGAGTDEVSGVPATVPADAPTGFVAERASRSAAVVLTWDAFAGDDGGAEVTGYQYRQRKDPGSFGEEWTAVAGAATTTATVDELAGESAHVFELRAVNDVGAATTTATASVPPVPVPGVPRVFAAVRGDKVIRLEWLPPAD